MKFKRLLIFLLIFICFCSISIKVNAIDKNIINIEKKQYTISYVLNGGTNSSKNPSTYSNTSSVTLKNPTRKGYNFDGWYSDSKFKNKVTSIKNGSTGNKTLYAKWTPIKYSIIYTRNGGTSGSTIDQLNLKYDKTYTLRSNGYKRTGYTFVGWNTKKDGKGKSYTDKEKVKNLKKTDKSSITLYAQWKKKSYKIKYELNGGTNSTKNPSTYTVTSSITFNNPTKKGYTFGGWYSDAKFKTKVTSIKKGTTGNKTLYAKWTKTKYTITYNLNGGKNSTSNKTSYTITDKVTLYDATKKGYLFDGWYLDAKFTKPILSIAKGTTGKKTLYAKFIKDTKKNRALKSAKSYIDIMPYSYSDLVTQLEYDGYTHEEAIYGVDNCGASWKEQALRSALLYIESTPFSYNGLVEQLESEGYTHEEAIYGVDNCEANWKEQAIKDAKSYLDIMPYSYNDLINQLEYDGFTHEEAIYGVDNCEANWKEQAVRSAEIYLDIMNFSYDELVEQLKSEGYTDEEAEYAASEVLIKKEA